MTNPAQQQQPDSQQPAWGDRAESLFQQIIERIESEKITGDETDETH